ncbi:MAG: hypothetical protein FJ294_01760 [Planctomycetes bacterium]|nr:hypothetical protein [Planctomycetota bacterium]
MAFALAPESSDWFLATMPWLLGLCAIAAGATAAGVWLLHQRLRELAHLGERLSALEQIQSTLARVAREREDLDLRRIEHVLIEIRDGQRRLEDSLLRASQAGFHGEAAGGAKASDVAGLSERIVQRLCAHGFEHVQVVPTLEELAKLLESAGAHEVLVEARRAGVQCKGRVLVRDGVVLEVEVKPAYSMFP